MSIVDGRRPRAGIALSEIHDALIKEWSDLSSEVESQTGNLPLRANTCTLVVITARGAAVRAVREALHQLAAAIPSRVLHFVFEPKQQTPTAEIWAHCALTPSGKQGGCYDVIEVVISPDMVNAIPNIVAIHRLGELPTFVVWIGQADIGSPGFRSVTSVADRLIIDTESYSRPLAALRDYAMFLGTAGSGVLGSDLAWARISTWRELIAQSFDSAPVRRYLWDIRGVDISYDDSQTSGAILLASWLGSRLNLEPVSATDSHTAMELRASSGRSDQRVTFNLHHSHQSGVGIRSVRILARSGSSASRISIIRGTGDTSTARVETSGMPRQERVVHHVDAPRHELIASEFMRYTRDRVFEESLSHAAEFCRILESKA